MKWINVEDSLPDRYARVIVTNGKEVCLHFKQSSWDFEGSEGHDLYSLDCEFNKNWACGIHEGTITHWMPLPPAPEQPVELKDHECSDGCCPAISRCGDGCCVLE